MTTLTIGRCLLNHGHELVPSQFSLFSQLPTEIRTKIWQAAFSDLRIIHICCFNSVHAQTTQFEIHGTELPFLSVCKEAYDIAVRSYEPLAAEWRRDPMDLIGMKGTRFNFDRDILELNTLRDSFRTMLATQKLKHLALALPTYLRYAVDRGSRDSVWMFFGMMSPRLNSLTILLNEQLPVAPMIGTTDCVYIDVDSNFEDYLCSFKVGRRLSYNIQLQLYSPFKDYLMRALRLQQYFREWQTESEIGQRMDSLTFSLALKAAQGSVIAEDLENGASPNDYFVRTYIDLHPALGLLFVPMCDEMGIPYSRYDGISRLFADQEQPG